MSTYYLRQKLAGADTDNGDPILTIQTDHGALRVYSPEPTEYRVNADVVEKAHELGAGMIAYAESWSGTTVEGEAHAGMLGLELLPFKAFFPMLRQRGVPLT